jgi:pyruvate/2-oxoglutarate/acetoin dehydrogenase E1 component
MTTVLDSLNLALRHALDEDERVLLIGEDILDPYGGAFKVTRGLSSAFPERVITSPISEAGIVGLATGMALRGLRPVVEIMFGDFITLAADQLINHASKFRWMYNDQVRVPLVVRTPMGGGRGYGPTHSQTLEKLFMGIPGLHVIAPSSLGDPGRLLRESVLRTQDPVLFIENKLLYSLPVRDLGSDPDFEINEFHGRLSASGEIYAPTFLMILRGAPPAELTITAYGYMVELARQAAHRLAYEHEVFVEVAAPTRLAPSEPGEIVASCRRTRRLLALEEGTHDLGWGAEIIAHAAEALGPRLLAAKRVAALNLPLPASRTLESAVLPDVEKIVKCAINILQNR